ncbi:hypothetical protein COB52_02555 [Candidatus Kaiserbacteria bacterium]|nr:MAG: hypothetical protein COB52_02555 [Candidatus Kaiserbacteria bacterium]
MKILAAGALAVLSIIVAAHGTFSGTAPWMMNMTFVLFSFLFIAVGDIYKREDPESLTSAIATVKKFGSFDGVFGMLSILVSGPILWFATFLPLKEWFALSGVILIGITLGLLGFLIIRDIYRAVP